MFFQVWEPLPPGIPRPQNHQQLTGDIIPLVIQPNLTPDELGRIYAAQIAVLIEEVATMEGAQDQPSG